MPFTIHDFLTLRVAKLCECGDFLVVSKMETVVFYYTAIFPFASGVLNTAKIP